ncbi:phage tail protein [Arthrobacter sp. VKM Ac-2550]|uniref:phage tail protein n=1 Tax=Crystallibacter permensis TaxID=1938888 RepID=UPI0022269224|nr:phage tail protein [Arthrobacter sp. VKM Ac-2550]MCW2131619.1 phage tail protein domain-containing protein [Arthrobacter sp. VKM Ac-2550]
MADPLLNILPEVFRTAAHTNRPLQALAAAAADMHAPAHRVLADLPEYFDPYRAPERMLPYLARWVDLDWLATGVPGTAGSVGGTLRPDRLRDLVANAAELSASRGTAGGLRRFLHLATGVPGFSIDDVPGAFHLNVAVPAAAADQLLLIRRIVEGSKPAHTTCRIEIEAAGPEPQEPEPEETEPEEAGS